MPRKTQGTMLYTVDPDTHAVLVVGCVTAIGGIDSTLEQIETTCLSDLARTYEAGLATPGAATFSIQFDPADESHVRLHQLKKRGVVLPWAVGFSDGISSPTTAVNSAGEDVFVLPTSRSWIDFRGFMNSFPFNAALNDMWESTVGIQVSGDPDISVKV